MINVGLLLKDNLEHSIVNGFKNINELSHRARDLFGVMLGAVHLLDQIEVDCDLASN